MTHRYWLIRRQNQFLLTSKWALLLSPQRSGRSAECGGTATCHRSSSIQADVLSHWWAGLRRGPHIPQPSQPDHKHPKASGLGTPAGLAMFAAIRVFPRTHGATHRHDLRPIKLPNSTSMIRCRAGNVSFRGETSYFRRPTDAVPKGRHPHGRRRQGRRLLPKPRRPCSFPHNVTIRS